MTAFTYHIPMAEYNALDAVRSSDVPILASGKTPLHVRQRRLDDEDTPSTRKGTALHLYLLEPDRADLLVGIYPDRRAGKAWEAYRDTFAGEVILNATEAAEVHAMRDAVWKHSAAAALLRGATERELSVVVDLPEEAGPGLLKARFDALDLQRGCVVDVKSTRDASPDAFAWHAEEYGYYTQGALYRYAAHRAGWPSIEHHAIIAVENAPPWGVCVYRLMDSDLSDAWEEAMPHLRTLAECHRTGQWPGSPDTVQDLVRPARARERALERMERPK